MFETFVLHIPHSGLELPSEYLGKEILVPGEVLRLNAAKEADLYIDQLFQSNNIVTLQPAFSRNVCDVERFRQDEDEPESVRGRGLFYTHFENGLQFREYSVSLRQKVLAELYDPHHTLFTRAVEQKIQDLNTCLIVDCHSFSDAPGYPDFCIGIDHFHTPVELANRLQCFITQLGYSVQFDFPYAGSIVPISHYQKERRVKSVMIEVNKRLYMDEASFAKNENFDTIHTLCKEMLQLLASFHHDNGDR